MKRFSLIATVLLSLSTISFARPVTRTIHVPRGVIENRGMDLVRELQRDGYRIDRDAELLEVRLMDVYSGSRFVDVTLEAGRYFERKAVDRRDRDLFFRVDRREISSTADSEWYLDVNGRLEVRRIEVTFEEGRGSVRDVEYVTCESVDFARQECRIDGLGRIANVTVHNQLSGRACVSANLGGVTLANFGFERNYVWVSGGCRAEFRVELFN